MECSKWEEYGLLFVSEELDSGERQSFEKHLAECSVCAGEEKAYRLEKDRFFTQEILCATPSAACDAEILRVCSDGRRKVTGFASMPLFIRRGVVSFMLFAIGFIGVGYITLKTSVGKRDAAEPVAASEASPASDQIAGTSLTPGNNVADSSSDSSSENGVNFSKTRGNLDLNGVYPVDLQSK
jgi:hypothetical protein